MIPSVFMLLGFSGSDVGTATGPSDIVVWGYGSWSGINALPTLGYGRDFEAIPQLPGIERTVADYRLHVRARDHRLHATADDNRLHARAKESGN